jgi:transposase
MQHGLSRASFIPPIEVRDLRELTRYRTSLTREQSRLSNRIQKVAESGDIKLSQVATDALGVSGRAMLYALVRGETDVEVMAEMSHKRLRGK